MIYFVTLNINSNISPNPTQKIISVEESLKYLKSLQIVGLDTETQGLDIWTGKLLTLQLGNKDFQVVIDCCTVDIQNYKEFLESDRLFIMHNAKFDLKWLYKEHILIKNIYDTYLAEKILFLGFPPGNPRISLKDCCKRHLGIELDKSTREKISEGILTDEIIEYAAYDVTYLEAIREKQMEIISSRNEEVALRIENSFVRVLAYVEFCGIKLDYNKWKAKMQQDYERVLSTRESLNNWVISWVKENDKPICRNYSSSMNTRDLVNKQGIYVVEPMPSLFENFNTGLQCILDWNSPVQMVKFFKGLGFDLTTKDKRTGVYKDSVDIKIISKQKDKSDIVPLYIAYSKSFKVVSAFGQNYLDAISPITGRIHPQFNQLMDTGRISCGSKDDNSVNIQQLPNNKETRGCFVAEEGNLLVDADYGDQEGRLFAEQSNDKAWIDFYNDSKKRDGHGFVAKMVFHEELKDVDELDVQEVRNDLRALAKSARFCFNYNGSAKTMATSCGISEEEANKIYTGYFTRFSGIASYFKKQKKDLWDRGYILINPITGLRSWIYNYPILKGIMNMQKSTPYFWEEYKQAKSSGQVTGTLPAQVVHKIAEKFSRGMSPMEIEGNYLYTTIGGKENLIFVNKETVLVQSMKYLWKEKSEWENSCCNFPTQGTSAAMTKIAGIKYFNHLIEKDLVFKVKFVNAVHDEYLIEVPEDIATEEAQILSQCMGEAAKIFCKKVVITSEPEIDKVWKH